MGMIYFGALTGMRLRIDMPIPYTAPPENTHKLFQIPPARPVTIAELAPECQGMLTAHHLRDYRHRRFSLILLPNIQLPLEGLIDRRDLGAAAQI